MSEDQITALAREYAEEYTKKKYPNAPGHVRERIVEGRLEHMEDFIPWLLRRFCLVEKSKVETKYKEAIEGKCELEKMQPQNTYAKNSIVMRIGVNFGCVHTLKSLFPDFGKEVQP